jgi:hypothetical protein|tara:strand:+ start:395 stop:538 length:144 start_codon:yes stop_codon:yes gene_type:complete
MNKNKYTQRQWDRTVGYGKIPDEYSVEKKKNEEDEQKDRSADEDTND